MVEMSKPEHPDEVEVAHADGLPCTGGCGRRLSGLADPDGILQGFTCSECQPVDSESATAWHTDSGGSYTLAEAEDRLRQFVQSAARLMGAADEAEAALRSALMMEARMHGVPFDEERSSERIAVMMAALNGVALPSGEPPARRCTICGEPNCEREECSLDPCPWCGADAYAGGASRWVDCSGPCGAIGPGHQTMPEAAAAWNALARNHREAPGLRERVAELEAERDALLERLARRDDEVTRLRSRT